MKNNIIIGKITYNFAANLQKSEDVSDAEYWNFQVLAENQSEAEKILLEYLSRPEQTGIKYKECVGLRALSSGFIIIKK